MKRELTAALIAAKLVQPTLPAFDAFTKERAADRRHAERIGKRVAKRWEAQRVAAKATGTSSPRIVASRAIRRGLASTVATENALSFSAVRSQAAAKVADAVAKANPDRADALVVARKWFAALDSCKVCRGYDDEIIAADDTWPDGEPGAVHPNCRCMDTLVIVRKSEL